MKLRFPPFASILGALCILASFGISTFGGAAVTNLKANSLTTPLVAGGTAAGSALELRATRGVGTTDYLKFTVGTNGTAESFRIAPSANVLFGTVTDTASAGLIQLPAATGAANGIYFGSTNANLYQSAAGVIRTSGAFVSDVGVGIGVSPSSAAGLDVRPTALAGLSQYGQYISPTGTVSGTSSVVGVYSAVGTAAASYTATSLVNFQAADAFLGAGSTITNLYGFFVPNLTKGAALNVGLNLAVLSGAGKYNVRATGTAQNVFAGSTRIGSAADPTEGLDVVGHIRSSGTTPTIASGACGTTSNGTIAGNDEHGKITIGAAATTVCTVTFGTAFTAAPPSCVFSPASAASAASTVLAYVSSITTGGFVITGAVLASTSFYYHCG